MDIESPPTKRQKSVRALFILACLMGSAVAIYVGDTLFHDRTSTFFIFIGYIVILTGVAILFGLRLIDMIFKQ